MRQRLNKELIPLSQGIGKIVQEEKMYRLAVLFLLAVASIPSFAAAQSFKNVAVVDLNCHSKVASNPDAHTRACALKCAASGYGIFTEDGKFLKLDAKGNKEVVQALKSSDQKDHLRVDVEGDVQGDTLNVTSLKLL